MKNLLSYRLLIPLAVLLGLAPFYPEPHVTQKMSMLTAGTLTRPIDIFDLFWHGLPIVVLGFRFGRDMGRKLERQATGREAKGHSDTDNLK
jgi:hypothetical protein